MLLVISMLVHLSELVTAVNTEAHINCYFRNLKWQPCFYKNNTNWWVL